MPPTLGNGKICYVEIPATNVEESAEFYQRVFGWDARKRGDGHTAFDDGVGQVSGTWVLNRPPSTTPGLLLYIMVDNAEETVQGDRGERRRDCAANRRRRAGDHRQVSRPRRQRDRHLSGAEESASSPTLAPQLPAIGRQLSVIVKPRGNAALFGRQCCSLTDSLWLC